VCIYIYIYVNVLKALLTYQLNIKSFLINIKVFSRPLSQKYFIIRENETFMNFFIKKKCQL
jgi:hypothetical protein